MCYAERIHITLTRGVKFETVNFTLKKEWSCTFLSHPSFGAVNFTLSRVNLASFAAVFRLVPPHKRLLNRAIHSFPIVLPIRQSNQSRSRKESL